MKAGIWSSQHKVLWNDSGETLNVSVSKKTESISYLCSKGGRMRKQIRLLLPLLHANPLHLAAIFPSRRCWGLALQFDWTQHPAANIGPFWSLTPFCDNEKPEVWAKYTKAAMLLDVSVASSCTRQHLRRHSCYGMTWTSWKMQSDCLPEEFLVKRSSSVYLYVVLSLGNVSPSPASYLPSLTSHSVTF